MQSYIYKIVLFILLISIIAFSNLKAEIIFTDLDPDETLAPPLNSAFSFHVNLNADNKGDFYFTVDNLSNGCAVTGAGILRKNQIAGTGDTNTTGDFYPLCFAEDEIIGGDESYIWFNDWDNIEDQDLKIPICGNGLNGPGHWAGGLEQGYLGVRFFLNGNYHYGWILMEIPEVPKVCTFKGFAYETEPNKPIKAGQIMTGVNDYIENDDLAIYPNPAREQVILFYQQDKTSEVEIGIYDFLGKQIQTVFKDCLEKGNYQFSINTKDIQSGIYIIKVKSQNLSINKKLIIE